MRCLCWIIFSDVDVCKIKMICFIEKSFIMSDFFYYVRKCFRKEVNIDWLKEANVSACMMKKS